MSPELKAQAENAEKEIMRWLIENARVLVKRSELAEIVNDKRVLRYILRGHGKALYYKVLGGRDPVYIVIIETPSVAVMMLIDELRQKYRELRKKMSVYQALLELNKYAAEKLYEIFYSKYNCVAINRLAYYNWRMALKYGVYTAEYYSDDVERLLVGGTWLEAERISGFVYVFRHLAAE